jgi:ABC-type multidrug transport system fused ATPase/permease subunit
MIIHYLKIAFHNMRKYKSQTLISVVGLAVGFTCFALATLWIVYEMTYDNFHKNAKQIYVVYWPTSISVNQTGYSRAMTPHSLAAYLKNTFPEVVNATFLDPPSQFNVTVEDVTFQSPIIRADSSFLTMFDLKILKGSLDYQTYLSRKLAITREKARQLFGDDDPIGKTVLRSDVEWTISAVVSGMSKHSNYSFDFIQPFVFPPVPPGSLVLNGNTMIELFPGTNVEEFEQKFYDHYADLSDSSFKLSTKRLKIKPLTIMRYTDPDIAREVKFQYIFIFAVSGLLVVLCAMFNYLALFVSRFRMRQKELALRVVCGASGGSLLLMLSVEFLLTLLFAVVMGFMLTQLMHKPFLAFSNIQMNLPEIYGELFIYLLGVILVSLVVFWLILFIFRRRSLNVSIRRSNKKTFRKISVVVQLLISVGFALCTIVMLKQMYFLHHTDELGFSFKNRGSLMVSGENSEVFANQLKQFPEITEVIHERGMKSLLPLSEVRNSSQEIYSWDDKLSDSAIVKIEKVYVSQEYASFYDFRLIEGEMLTDDDPETMVLLSESAVKAFGWYDPINKQFDNGKYTVKGVIKHVYNLSPTTSAYPVVYIKVPPEKELLRIGGGISTPDRLVLFKYQEGQWKSIMEKIEQMKNEYNILMFRTS